MTLAEKPGTTVDDAAQLRALVGEESLVVQKKVLDRLDTFCRDFIALSPFLVLATADREGGVDASPRGDGPGFVQVLDERTLLIPDRRGNNRIDSLRNLLHDPRVALLFLVPGVGETLRVNGRARILTTPALLQRLAMNGAEPRCVIEIRIESVYFQCARALQRSRLWAPPEPVEVPTAGQILAALTSDDIDGQAYDRELPQRQRSTLY